MPEMRSSVRLHYTEMHSGLFLMFIGAIVSGEKTVIYMFIHRPQWLHTAMALENIDLAI